MDIKFDPEAHKIVSSAAKALYDQIREQAQMDGQDPNTEVRLQSPIESLEDGCGYGWRVVWRAGPYNWGKSFKGGNPKHGRWFTSFTTGDDVCFSRNS